MCARFHCVLWHMQRGFNRRWTIFWCDARHSQPMCYSMLSVDVARMFLNLSVYWIYAFMIVCVSVPMMMIEKKKISRRAKSTNRSISNECCFKSFGILNAKQRLRANCFENRNGSYVCIQSSIGCRSCSIKHRLVLYVQKSEEHRTDKSTTEKKKSNEPQQRLQLHWKMFS